MIHLDKVGGVAWCDELQEIYIPLCEKYEPLRVRFKDYFVNLYSGGLARYAFKRFMLLNFKNDKLDLHESLFETSYAFEFAYPQVLRLCRSFNPEQDA